MWEAKAQALHSTAVDRPDRPLQRVPRNAHLARSVQPLGPDDGAVAPPGTTPVVVEVGRTRGEGMAGGQRLVHVDPEARSLAREHIAIPDLRAPGEDLPRPLGEKRPFVDAEVVARQLEGELGRVAHRRGVAGAVPGRLHAEELAEGLRLA